MKVLSKRGDSTLAETVIFIILNLIFFIALLIFVYRSGTGALVYEQAYAKEIALFLDNAKPDTDLSINIQDGMKIAEKAGQKIENSVRIQDNKVIVSLTGKGGYSYQYFSDYSVEYRVSEDGFVYLKIREKNE